MLTQQHSQMHHRLLQLIQVRVLTFRLVALLLTGFEWLNDAHSRTAYYMAHCLSRCCRVSLVLDTAEAGFQTLPSEDIPSVQLDAILPITVITGAALPNEPLVLQTSLFTLPL